MSTHSQNTIRILVVDDHTLFRRGLTALLARDPQLVVVGDAADAGQAQRKAQQMKQGALVRTAAMDAGFADTAHLSRAFCETFGLTPSAAIGALPS